MTSQHVRRLRAAGPAAWLVVDGAGPRVTGATADPYDLVWVCTANAFTDLAQARTETGTPRTDDDLAAALTLAARHLAGEWPLVCLLWPLIGPIAGQLADHEISRCGTPGLFTTGVYGDDGEGDEVLGIRQTFAPAGHDHRHPVPHVRVEIPACPGRAVTIACGDRTYELAPSAPQAAIAAFCAALIANTRPETTGQTR